MNAVETVTAVLMDNDVVRSYLYSEWDDGHDVGKLAERIVAALAESSGVADQPEPTEPTCAYCCEMESNCTGSRHRFLPLGPMRA